jgi:diacylglycerol kinase
MLELALCVMVPALLAALEEVVDARRAQHHYILKQALLYSALAVIPLA